MGLFGAVGWCGGGGCVSGGCVQLTEEAEALEFGDGFVEAVFEAASVHEEAVEDAGVGEVFDDDAAEGEVGIGVRWGTQGSLESGEGAGGVFGVEGVEGLVLEAFGALESPGESYGAVGEGGLDGAFGGEFGEHLVAVEFEFALIFADNDGLAGAQAVLEGVLGDGGLAFGGAGAGGFAGVETIGLDLGWTRHGLPLDLVFGNLHLVSCWLYA